jgi:hypothetical protein
MYYSIVPIHSTIMSVIDDDYSLINPATKVAARCSCPVAKPLNDAMDVMDRQALASQALASPAEGTDRA